MRIIVKLMQDEILSGSTNEERKPGKKIKR